MACVQGWWQPTQQHHTLSACWLVGWALPTRCHAVLCCPTPCCAALCRLKALNPRLSGSERTAAVDDAMEQMRRLITGMAGALGTEHLLVSAATCYMAQLSVMLGQQRQ